MMPNPAHGAAAFRQCSANGADCAVVATKQGRRADWEAIHAEYRAGLLSLREIAAEYHVSHTAIRKRAVRDGWQRDLRARIKARADALVSRVVVSSEVSTESKVADAVIVESNARAVVQTRLQHRRDIARARAVAASLLDGLEVISANLPLIERLAAAVAKGLELVPKEVDQHIATVRKAFDLPSRAGMLKSLADTIAKLIALEREAYGLDSEPDRNKNVATEHFAEILRQIDGVGTGLPRRPPGYA